MSFPRALAHRDGGLQFLQIGFEKMVGDDQRLDGFAGIYATSRLQFDVVVPKEIASCLCLS
jgi:hypothetical protein